VLRTVVLTKPKAACGIFIDLHIVQHSSGPRQNKQIGHNWRLSRSVAYRCQLHVKLLCGAKGGQSFSMQVGYASLPKTVRFMKYSLWL